MEMLQRPKPQSLEEFKATYAKDYTGIRVYYSGSIVYIVNGKYHREDGPAFEYFDGTKDWWVNDKLLPCQTQEEFEKLMRLRAFW